MQAPDPHTHLDRPTYLERSKTWEQKHEWINGHVYAMSGGSFRHNAIGINVASALLTALRGTPCRSTSSDQRIYVAATGASLYPDVSVVCSPFIPTPDDERGLTNPTLIVEVLSPSTRSYDLGAKLEHYLRLPSVHHVLYIESEEQHCILYSRTTGAWIRHDVLAGAIPLKKLGLELSFEMIYADLEQLS